MRSRRLFNASAEKVMWRLRKNLFSHVIVQEVGFFDRVRTGELMNRLSEVSTHQLPLPFSACLLSSCPPLKMSQRLLLGLDTGHAAHEKRWHNFHLYCAAIHCRGLFWPRADVHDQPLALSPHAWCVLLLNMHTDIQAAKYNVHSLRGLHH